MSDKKICTVSLEEVLYYLMFSLLLFIKGIGLDEGNLFFRLCLVVAMGLFAAKIVVGKYTLLELAVIAVGGLWGVFLFFNMGSFGILIYMLMLLGMKNISVEKTMKVGLAVWAVCMFVTVTAGIFFERYGVRVVHEKFGLGPLLRESLGYGHPNVLHITYILLMAFALYCSKKENTIRTILLLILGNGFIFLYSMSYTGLMLSVVLVIAHVYFVYRERRTKVENFLIQMILPMCIVLTMIIVPLINVNSSIYRLLNALLSNRVYIIMVYFSQHDLTFLGERFEHGNLSLDNSYLYALGWYGVIFFVVAMAAYVVLVHNYVKNDRKRELAILCAFLVGGLTEQFLFNGSIKNITVIFLGEVLYQLSKNRGKEICLLERYNRELTISTGRLEESILLIKQLLCKKMLIRYALIGTIVTVAAFFIPLKKYEEIYVNEKHCHYYEETVKAEEIVDESSTIVIGNRDEGERFHYFTRENSNLIQFSEVRYRVALGIYLTILIMIVEAIYGIYKSGHWKNRRRTI